jgi:hypothetical protein
LKTVNHVCMYDIATFAMSHSSRVVILSAFSIVLSKDDSCRIISMSHDQSKIGKC